MNWTSASPEECLLLGTLETKERGLLRLTGTGRLWVRGFVEEAKRQASNGTLSKA